MTTYHKADLGERVESEITENRKLSTVAFGSVGWGDQIKSILQQIDDEWLQVSSQNPNNTDLVGAYPSQRCYDTSSNKQWYWAQISTKPEVWAWESSQLRSMVIEIAGIDASHLTQLEAEGWRFADGSLIQTVDGDFTVEDFRDRFMFCYNPYGDDYGNFATIGDDPLGRTTTVAITEANLPDLGLEVPVPVWDLNDDGEGCHSHSGYDIAEYIFLGDAPFFIADIESYVGDKILKRTENEHINYPGYGMNEFEQHGVSQGALDEFTGGLAVIASQYTSDKTKNEKFFTLFYHDAQPAHSHSISFGLNGYRPNMPPYITIARFVRI